MLALSPPRPTDLHDLFTFETVNRRYFEQHINARPADYYSLEGVQAAIESALRDAREDKAYQYLVRDEAGALVARVNLTRVRRDHFHSAELGYRVAEAATGRGHAREAVRLALREAFELHGLRRIEATARPGNPASVQVLRRNGFTEFGRSTRSFQLSGEWHDLLHFERHA
jgi:[ribosomal protein S5]-alanine N-acetyltransferase